MKNYFYLLVCFLLTQSAFAQEKMDIFDVARKGTVVQAAEIIKIDSKAINSLNKDGFSPLMLACYRANNPLVKFLLENGSNINEISAMGTPLMAAIVKGNVEATNMLLDKKANVNLTDNNGTTALIYATMFNNVPLVKLLLASKSDKTKVDNKGKTAFEYAVFSNNEELINLLK